MPILSLTLILALSGDLYDGVPLTVNRDPSQVPESRADWLLEAPATEPLTVRTILPASGSPDVLLLFEDGLTDSLGDGLLEQWIADMTLEGVSTEVLEVSYAEPTEIRGYLQGRYAEDGIEGALLIGNLPVPWSALDNAYLDEGEQFPSDYFYMDLDGLWDDLWIGYPSEGRPGTDGMYDTWRDELDPEIYVARIRVDNLQETGDPIDLLDAYLQRNHDWRTLPPSEPPVALCYVDDDWAAWGTSYRNAMLTLYDDVVLVDDPDSTNGTDYLYQRLPGDWEWISPYVHSSPLIHQWSPGPSTHWFQIVPAEPQARFYNLFACSNARFTTASNMGGVYTFSTSTGLASVGSTKSGSMLGFAQFYYPMGQGSSIGEAYMSWWDSIAGDGLTPYELSWHLGMVLLGDPTLVPAMHMLGIGGGTSPGAAGPELRPSMNPCSGTVSFTVTGDVAGPLFLYDLGGRLAASAPLSGGGCTLDVSGLEPGVYLARAGSGARFATAPLVVSR